MKKYIQYAFTALAFMGLTTSCDNFGDVNTDPEHLNEGNISHAMVFTNAQHQALGSDWDIWRNGIIYLAQWNQHIAAGGWWWSYGLNSFSEGYSAALWDGYSGRRSAIRDITNVMNYWKENKVDDCYQIARIMRAYIFHHVTDMYGDVPYSEAALPAEFSYPKYDSQEFIYKDMLKELDEAQAALGTGFSSLGKQDIYYAGDMSAWKKFANSLMLRLGMRLSKVDAAEAQKWVAKAYANGVILKNEDNCLLNHPGGSVNDDSSEPYAKVYAQLDPSIGFINTTFYNILKDANDPRIPLIMCVVQENPKAAYTSSDYNFGESNPEIQKPIPGCYSMSPSSDYFIGKYFPEFADESLYSDDKYKTLYSQPNRKTYADPEAPTFVMTAAQTNLLLAEAAQRGWIKGSAEDFYKAGVRAAMEQFSQFPNGKKLYDAYMSEEKIQEYLANNPFDASKALEQINTQYWITCFCDEYEAFSNWRRSDFPKLTYPNLSQKELPGVNHNLSRRFTYPTNESLINADHYSEAVNKLENGNTFESRVWWDAK